MRGKSLDFCYLLFVFFMLVIVTPELWLRNAGVFTSCYVPVEGQCFLNIQRAIFWKCAVSGTTCELVYVLCNTVLINITF
jgi:hypothetical protein